MQRIGIAASKMAKGSLLRYNLFVIWISWLFSLFLFFISGFSVLLVLFLISLMVHGFTLADFSSVGLMCMGVLAFIIGLLNIVAILKNIKINKNNL